MDKSWISKPRATDEYEIGLGKFLDFAFEKAAVGNRIQCPCSKCGFIDWQTRDIAEDHLKVRPFPENYVIWSRHGEKQVSGSSRNEDLVQESSRNEDLVQEASHYENPIETMVNDAFGHYRQQAANIDEPQPLGANEILNEESREGCSDFHEFMNDGNQILNEGSKYTKLEFIIKLYHIKVLCGLSDKAMTMILDLLRDAFQQAKLPPSFYEAKKIINKLGLNYTKIDACPNHCMLYLGDDEKDLQTCKHCGTSRWNPKKKKKQALKVLRYFPLKARLQRLFMCCKTAEHMRWHATESNKDGLIRHPRDGEAWKTFDLMHPEFALNPRNVRLGLASDGFNPFGTMSSSYSIWPVFLIPYNFPPWMCMKHTSFILSMIIPGKKMPGNKIDVYLQPLINELNELWNDGVVTFDASMNENFRMRAALMWTISDFPGLGNLSGWNTHTGLACPTCNFDAEPCRLPHSKKWCFMGHRRFLSRNHRFRLNRVRFDGSTEERSPPLKISGSDVLKQVENINVTSERGLMLDGRRKRSRQETKQWNKRSIFFELPYWESNLLRHNLDFMHIEKNVCDNVLYTLLHEKPQSKDNLNARKDLKDMGIRHDLWPDEKGRYHLALFSLTRDTKKLFLKTLKNVKVPDGYSSNISRCVDEAKQKIFGLKSHDSHIIMEQFLPLAIRNLLPNHVTAVLVEFCSFFRVLCGKSLSLSDLQSLQDRIVITLCHLEMLFPPSFFTVMVHLTVHLIEEAKLGGPVHYRYMYPVERELGHLKSFVRNKAQPEGSIAEGYLAEESLTFCSRYLQDIETRFNRPRRVCDDPNENESSHASSIFPQLGKPVGASSIFALTQMQKLQAHRYVLLNCAIVAPFVDEFRQFIKRGSRSRRPSATEIEKRVYKEFGDWFQKRIMNPETINTMSADLKFLARGPLDNARRFTGYNINGFKFRTLAREEGLRTQNSGVFLTSNTSCVSSSADRNSRQADLPYYGKLEDIIEINYYGQFKVILFKCKWAETTRDRGYKKDSWNFNCVNFERLIHIGDREEHDPYIEASQAQMVYYVDDVVNKGWSVVVHLKPRDLYEMGEEVEDEVYENEPYQEQQLEQFCNIDDEYVQLATNHLNDDVVESNMPADLATNAHMSE